MIKAEADFGQKINQSFFFATTKPSIVKKMIVYQSKVKTEEEEMPLPTLSLMEIWAHIITQQLANDF